MELFKKKKKEENADERVEPQGQTAETGVPTEADAEDGQESVPETDAPVETDPVSESGTEEVATVKMPEASVIAAGIGKPELEEALRNALNSLLGGIETGMIAEETAELLALGLDYERAVKEADAAGEIRGRNAAIEEKLLTLDDGDGIPHPGCGQGAASPMKSLSIFDLARNAR